MAYTYSYPRPALTVDALVLAGSCSERKILLIQRGKDPFQGMWALPGGFTDMEETLEQACLRELEEETGLRLGKMEQFKVFDALNRDPRHRTITVVFRAEVPEEVRVNGSDDAADARWFPMNDLPPLAFDHRQIIEEFLAESGLR